MKVILNWIKNNPNRSMFLVPILLVAAISISHVVTWYDIANPINWAIYLSIAIEIGAMTALVAATNQIKGGVWFMFGLVTFIQMVGNIFYSYKEIDETGELFKSWVELTGPIWELMGTEVTDVVGLKRYLAFLEGGLLPIISLTSLHFFVKYEKSEEDTYNTMSEHPEDDVPKTDKKTFIVEVNDTPKKEVEEYVEKYKEKITFESDVDDVLPNKVDDSINVEISERMDNRVDGYIGDEEELKTVVEESVEDTENEILEKEVVNRKVVKQPIKPPKSKINRIN
jgi:hypothetical protein